MLHSYSLHIGYVDLVCPKRLFLIGMLNLRLAFGSSYVCYYSVGLHWVVVTILKPMDWVKGFTGRLSNFFVVIVLIINKNGRTCSRNVNLHSILQFRMPYVIAPLGWFTVLSLAYRWTLFCPMCRYQRYKTLSQLVSRFCHRFLKLFRVCRCKCQVL